MAKNGANKKIQPTNIAFVQITSPLMRIHYQNATTIVYRKESNKEGVLLHLYETHADGFRAFDRTAGGRQRTRITINTKNDDIVRILVSDE